MTKITKIVQSFDGSTETIEIYNNVLKSLPADNLDIEWLPILITLTVIFIWQRDKEQDKIS